MPRRTPTVRKTPTEPRRSLTKRYALWPGQLGTPLAMHLKSGKIHIDKRRLSNQTQKTYGRTVDKGRPVYGTAGKLYSNESAKSRGKFLAERDAPIASAAIFGEAKYFDSYNLLREAVRKWPRDKKVAEKFLEMFEKRLNISRKGNSRQRAIAIVKALETNLNFPAELRYGAAKKKR